MLSHSRIHVAIEVSTIIEISIIVVLHSHPHSHVLVHPHILVHVHLHVHVLILVTPVHLSFSGLQNIGQRHVLLGFVDSVMLHGVSHGLNFFRLEGEVHEMEVVLATQQVVDVHADVQSLFLHVLAFAINHDLQGLHDVLQSFRVELGDLVAHLLDELGEEFDGELSHGNILVEAEAGGH